MREPQQARVVTHTEGNHIGMKENAKVGEILGMANFTNGFEWQSKVMNDIICNYLVTICKNICLYFTNAHLTKNL